MLAGAFAAGADPMTRADQTGAPASVEEPEVPHFRERGLPSHEESSALCRGTRIRSFRFETLNVFDTARPEEDKAFFHVVNALHRPMLTRESTLQNRLILEVGEPCTPERLAEAERALRQTVAFQDAVVRAVEREGEEVDVVVRVQDAWSTEVRASFSNEGGETESSFRLIESNLLGYNKELSFEYASDPDRDERILEYRDPALFGSRWRLDVLEADNSDGVARRYRLNRPFYRLESTWAMELLGGQEEREEKVYSCATLGETCFDPIEADLYDVDEEEALFLYGLAPRGGSSTWVLRYALGLAHRSESSRNARARSLLRPDLRPRDFSQSAGVFGFEWGRIDFREEHFLNTAQRVEDVDLSERVALTLGLTWPGLTADSGGFVELRAQSGRELGGGYGFLRLDATARRIGDDWYRALVELEATWLHKPTRLQSTRLTLIASHGRHLDGPSRFLLGGEFGLRAYGARSFVGSNKLIAVAERRFFTPWYVAELLRLGLVAFVEAGGAWDEDTGFSWSEIHPGVGVGLRAQIIRSAGGTTVHFNAAYPLDPNGGPGNGSLRFSVLTATSF